MMNRESSSVTVPVGVPVASESTRNGRKVMRSRKGKKFSERGGSPAGRRKSLQMLQPAAGNQTKLVGSDGFVRLASRPSRTPKRKSMCDGRSQPKKVFRPDGTKDIFTIFEDASKPSSSAKSPEQDAVAMMTQETPPETYWKELAETRSLTLEKTLKENKQLHSENAELKKENERLKVMADQAEYLADVVETLIGSRKSSAESDSEEKEEKSASSEEEKADCRSAEESSPDSDCNDDRDDVFDEESADSGDQV